MIKSSIKKYLPLLAKKFKISLPIIEKYLTDLTESSNFLQNLNLAIKNVPEFSYIHFDSVFDLRIYRCLLYMITRIIKPKIIVETGVLNGFSSAFILLGLEHNKVGKLYSIDLPPKTLEILNQGNRPLPKGKKPGWIIPDYLKQNHKLSLGSAEILLPQLLVDLKSIDLFIHDSDHCYIHMMLELCIAWSYIRNKGWIISDNIEQNYAFRDFCRGVKCQGFSLSSFNTINRVWKHGLVQKEILKNINYNNFYK